MDFTIKTHGLEITDSIRAYVQKKLERVQSHLDHVIGLEVLLVSNKTTEKEKRNKACATLRVRGADIYAEALSEDLYAAIDKLHNKLDRQAKEYHDKRKDHHRHDALKYQLSENMYSVVEEG